MSDPTMRMKMMKTVSSLAQSMAPLMFQQEVAAPIIRDQRGDNHAKIASEATMAVEANKLKQRNPNPEEMGAPVANSANFSAASSEAASEAAAAHPQTSLSESSPNNQLQQGNTAGNHQPPPYSQGQYSNVGGDLADQ